MSFAPRSSTTRRRLLAEGRLRVAVLALGASVLGATAGVLPAIAGDEVPGSVVTCTDATTIRTETVDLSGDDPCATPPLEAPGDAGQDADPPGGQPEETTTDPTTQVTPPVPPADPGQDEKPVDPAETTPVIDADPEAPAADPTPPAAVVEPAALPVAPESVAKPDAAGSPKEAAPPKKTKTARAKPKATSGRAAKSERRRRRAEGRRDRDRRTGGEDGGRRAATPGITSYEALPASWTSLDPLPLAIESLDGFPIPPSLLPIYQAAGAQYGIPWEVLASINEIETDFGRNAVVSSAGALGWMQFIASSWERWGTDSDRDGRRDPRDPVDAIFAAARYLRDAGAAEDLPKAIFAYNHAGWYVEKVVARARAFASLDPEVVGALTERALEEDTPLYRARGNPFAGDGAVEPSAGQALMLTTRQLRRIALDGTSVVFSPANRADVVEGRVDRRVLETLVFLSRSGMTPTVSSLRSDHGRMTASGNVSAHSYGHAVDISAINGTSIAGNQGPNSTTARTLAKLVRLQGYSRPNQVISLMTIDGADNTLAMGDHADHIHVGFPRVPDAPDGARPVDVTVPASAPAPGER